MARSYKKNPIIKYGGCRSYKNVGNRKVRRMHKRGDYSIADGKSYRYTVSPYDIYDCWSQETWKEWKERCLKDDEASYSAYKYNRMAGKEDPREIDWKTEYRCWYTCYKMK